MEEEQVSVYCERKEENGIEIYTGLKVILCINEMIRKAENIVFQINLSS
jgi:hypothetical protein